MSQALRPYLPLATMRQNIQRTLKLAKAPLPVPLLLDMCAITRSGQRLRPHPVRARHYLTSLLHQGHIVLTNGKKRDKAVTRAHSVSKAVAKA